MNLTRHTFCLVWLPAPGHSVMMSSFASVFVANANATPENVVPYMGISCLDYQKGFWGSVLQSQCPQ